ncbi:MAG: hypothetical protein KBE09_04790 [Candidatus Pacebacteria bacterium]|nr:hypothetical protein [Candidatus Paceibacterota bacterium]
MKKPYTWAGIIGIIIVVADIVQISSILTHPTSVPLADHADIFGAFMQALFGAFLVWIYLYYKGKEERGELQGGDIKPGSLEEAERVKRMQQWGVILYSLFAISASAPIWYLADFSQGLTLTTAFFIFDIISSLGIFAVVVALLRGRPLLQYLLILTVVMGIGEAIILYFRNGWLYASLVLLAIPYFAFAIKAPSTRTNFRIATFLILPLSFAVGAVLSNFIQANLTAIAKESSRIEQELGTQNLVSAQAYEVFLQKEKPTQSDIQSVIKALDKVDELTKALLENAKSVKAEYDLQMSSASRLRNLAFVDEYTLFLEVSREQADVMRNLMQYALTVDFGALNQEQVEKLEGYKQRVAELAGKISNAAHEMKTD